MIRMCDYNYCEFCAVYLDQEYEIEFEEICKKCMEE